MTDLFRPKDQKGLDELIKPKAAIFSDIFVYSDGSNILGLESWDSKPFGIYPIGASDDIYCLCYHNGGLYAGTAEGCVFEIFDDLIIDEYSHEVIDLCSVDGKDLYSVDSDSTIRNVLDYNYVGGGNIVSRDEITECLCGYRGTLLEGGESGISKTFTETLILPTDGRVVGMCVHKDWLYWGGFDSGVMRLGSHKPVSLDKYNIGDILSHDGGLYCQNIDEHDRVYDALTGECVFKTKKEIYSMESVPRRLLEDYF